MVEQPKHPGAARRVRTVLAALVAFGFVFCPAVAHLLGVRPQAIENRPPAPRPDFSTRWAALDNVSAWATDQLPGRAQALHANSWIAYHGLRELTTDKVVRGDDGYLFLADDWDHACQFKTRYPSYLARILDLAQIIHDSGRRVVFTVAPDKSSVATDQLPGRVPTGGCGRSAIAGEQRVIKSMTSPLHLDILAPLQQAQAKGLQPYWRTDTHWSTVGASIYGQQLYSMLAPQQASSFRATAATATRHGDLFALNGLTSPERAPSREVSVGGTVHLDAFDKTFDGGGEYYGPQHWTVSGPTNALPGRTLLLGDSFTYYGLDALRPLFADGSFYWTHHFSQADTVAQIKASDTVVIEVVERWVGTKTMFVDPKFQRATAKALGVSLAAGSP